MRTSVQFSQAELALYHELSAQGLSARLIAEQLPGRTTSSIRHLGERLRNAERRALLAGGKIDWTNTNITRLRELHAQGLDAFGIARQMRASYSSINCAIAKHCTCRQEQLRGCMICGNSFPSSHRGHRICGGCKASETYRCAA